MVSGRPGQNGLTATKLAATTSSNEAELATTMENAQYVQKEKATSN